MSLLSHKYIFTTQYLRSEPEKYKEFFIVMRIQQFNRFFTQTMREEGVSVMGLVFLLPTFLHSHCANLLSKMCIFYF